MRRSTPLWCGCRRRVHRASSPDSCAVRPEDRGVPRRAPRLSERRYQLHHRRRGPVRFPGFHLSSHVTRREVSRPPPWVVSRPTGAASPHCPAWPALPPPSTHARPRSAEPQPSPPPTQGCSTLSTTVPLGQCVESGESSGVSLLVERCSLIAAQDIVGEAAYSGENPRIATDPELILLE